MSGKRYPKEFKIEAVKKVVDRGYFVSSVATRLDQHCIQIRRPAKPAIVLLVYGQRL